MVCELIATAHIMFSYLSDERSRSNSSIVIELVIAQGDENGCSPLPNVDTVSQPFLSKQLSNISFSGQTPHSSPLPVR